MRPAAIGLGLASAIGFGALLVFPRAQPFPHERHAGLFPTCAGCHLGATTGEGSLYSVTGEDCAACHDGVDLDAVEWSPPSPPPTNLVFDHGHHAAEIAEESREELACVDCHQGPGEERMDVVRVAIDDCMDCHAPDSPSHFAASVDCATCHVSLASAGRLSTARIEAFPQPDEHTAEDFLLTHGEMAEAGEMRCAICHARPSCERCHLNADRLSPIVALDPDDRVAALVADRPGSWPEPASHAAAEWLRSHGRVAEEDPVECANCHARESCEGCHAGGGPAVVASLPSQRPGGPRGVVVADVQPVGHPPGWIGQHATAAALGSPNCSTCHTERQCLDCHDGATRPGFHPVGFVLHHGAEAFARETECASCHSSEAFCRDCHSGLGFAAGARTTGGVFHDAQPDWLIAHGRAARQDLESCVGCHREESCLRCHSAKSGWRVSPHGPDFDPDRVADASTQSCGICHFELP